VGLKWLTKQLNSRPAVAGRSFLPPFIAGISLNIETDIVSPAYVGFYHVPLSWCAELPSDQVWIQGALEELFKVVHEGELNNGLRFRVRRDGFIWFDCNDWFPGTNTIIPGYSAEPGSKVPKKVTEAEKLAEQRAHNRAMLVNAYQLCLNSSHAFVKKRSTGLGAPIQSTHLVHLTDFSNPISRLYASTIDPYCIYINSALDSIANREQSARNSRRLVEIEVIANSFELLNSIIMSKFDDSLKIVELIYWAHHRYSENSFSDSLILSWAVCEKTINHLWGEFLHGKRAESEEDVRINKERARKLKGRDFTASIVSEVLELSEVLETQLFRRVDDTRKKRNAWLHSLDGIDDRDAANAMRAATELFEIATGVTLRPSISRTMAGTGGVPLEMYDFDKKKS
jgi:hypothetical protein